MKTLVSTLKRGAVSGEVHGRLLLCDWERKNFQEVAVLDSPLKSDNLRGGDRGFRGVEIDKKRSHYVVTTFDSVRFYNYDYKLVKELRHPAFVHLHDLSIDEDSCFICATGINQVLELNLDTNEIAKSYTFRRNDLGGIFVNVSKGFKPSPRDSIYLHLNSIYTNTEGFTVSGARSQFLGEVRNGALATLCALPIGAHNSFVCGDKYVFLDSDRCQIGVIREGRPIYTSIPCFPAEIESMFPPLHHTLARPYFARGMCDVDDEKVVFGHSPPSMCLFDISKSKILDQWVLESDVRWMVSGVARI